MAFDWLTFVKSYDIPYVTSGPNTKQGEISIKCPLCGDDPSEHLGLNLDKGYWACWRDSNHRGQKPYKLIVALLNCSYAQARLIVDQYSITDADEFDNLDTDYDDEKEDEKTYTKLHFPPDFKLIKNYGSTRKFWRYLRRRGFTNVNRLCERYSLKCCNVGDWQNRIIIPIYHDNELITWTSRAIGKVMKAPRYRTLSVDEPGKYKALDAITETVFGYDTLAGGKMLIVTEGPIDAMKFDFYGRGNDVRSTCLFTSSITISQTYLLSQLAKVFKQKYVLLDPEAEGQQLDILDQLRMFGFEGAKVPDGIEDPGAMNEHQIIEYIKGLKRTVA